MASTRGPVPTLFPLDGDWDFAYEPELQPETAPPLPASGSYATTMPVPGYWDDHIERIRHSDLWGKTRFNPDWRPIRFPIGTRPPDASLPYLLGVGWYRKAFRAPAGWGGRCVTLRVGGVTMEAWVWLNGSCVGHHLGHSTPFEMPLDGRLRAGEENELVIAVSNLRDDRGGSAVRGYAGQSAGIHRSACLRVSRDLRITSLYLRPIDDNREIFWTLEAAGKNGERDEREFEVAWRIRERRTGAVLRAGRERGRGRLTSWTTQTFGMRPWSDRAPSLYSVEVQIKRGGVPQDAVVQDFGLRTLRRDGTGLRLNGRPLFLRGVTEHHYFPLTCTAPRDVDVYRENLRRLKSLGFNWLRFHTWVPSEDYMRAADEVGVMIQVEPPVGFGPQEWADILRTARRHPSIVIYCCGNEQLLDEEKIEFLREMAALCKEYAPDALFSPQEALRGVEYYYQRSNLGEDAVDKPYPHNPRRLALLKEFSDVLANYAWGMLSYGSVSGDWRVLDERLAAYERPCLSHELCIHGNYLNLDLERRYEGTRIGPALYAAVRDYLRENGLLHRAPLYYRNSCAWMRILRKHAIETARKCRYNAGYDLLGGTDHHWHRTGYPSGIMNEFYELKPGESASDVLRYNGESVLLLDHTHRRNFWCGDAVSHDLYVSLYGPEPLPQAEVSWRLRDSGGRVHRRGTLSCSDVPNGAMSKLGTVSFLMPELPDPSKMTLCVRLSGGDYEIDNRWDFWAFPVAGPPPLRAQADSTVRKLLAERYPGLSARKASPGPRLRIVSALDEEGFRFLSGGGDVVLLGHAPFRALPTSFQMSTTGRAEGNLATAIADHPLFQGFPHEGFCDWQFYSLLGKGQAVLFDDPALPFDPIVEVVSSFKLIRKQASVFEFGVDKGRLLACSFALDLSDPAAVFLLNRMLAYVSGEAFQPRTRLSLGMLGRLVSGAAAVHTYGPTDQAFDLYAQLKVRRKR